MFLDALSYPIRRSGWVMIVLGSVLAVILDLLQAAPFFGLMIAVLSGGYFSAFYLDIISTTIMGRDEAPDWPDISSFMDDILAPFLRLLMLCVISFGLVVVVAVLGDEEEAWYLPALLASIVLGSLYFPMAVLGAQAFGNIFGASPHLVIPAIFRAMPLYLGVWFALLLVFVGSGLAGEFLGKIPYVGWFVTAAVGLYGLMFQGRLIGLLYREKQARMGWE